MRARKSLSIVVLALALAAPIASADAFGDLWSSLLRAVERAGSSMDPNGNDSRGTMDPDGGKSRGTMDPDGNDSRGTMDPDGGGATDPNGLRSAVAPDGRGPYIDPNGAAAGGADRGLGMDPNGG